VPLQGKFVVQAAGATKKLKNAGKNAVKSVKRNLPSKLPGKPGKALKKASKGSGDSWYGPNRALFLGDSSLPHSFPYLADTQGVLLLLECPGRILIAGMQEACRHGIKCIALLLQFYEC